MNHVRLDRRRVRSNFHRQADEYERYAVVQRRVVQTLLDAMDVFPRPPGPVLEIGCGTGLLSRELVSRCADSALVLSDLAPGMTRAAARSLRTALAVDADALALPFGDGRFGMVTSSSVYQWVEPLAAAFAEARRVLVPGGLLAVTFFGSRTLFELREAHRRAVAECGAGRVSHVLEFAAAGQIRSDLTAAGLEEVHFAAFDEVEWHCDVPDLLRSLKGLGAGNASSRRPGGLASRRVMQRMAGLYEQQHARTDGIPATYEVVCLVARRP